MRSNAFRLIICVTENNVDAPERKWSQMYARCQSCCKVGLHHEKKSRLVSRTFFTLMKFFKNTCGVYFYLRPGYAPGRRGKCLRGKGCITKKAYIIVLDNFYSHEFFEKRLYGILPRETWLRPWRAREVSEGEELHNQKSLYHCPVQFLFLWIFWETPVRHTSI